VNQGELIHEYKKKRIIIMLKRQCIGDDEVRLTQTGDCRKTILSLNLIIKKLLPQSIFIIQHFSLHKSKNRTSNLKKKKIDFTFPFGLFYIGRYVKVPCEFHIPDEKYF